MRGRDTIARPRYPFSKGGILGALLDEIVRRAEAGQIKDAADISDLYAPSDNIFSKSYANLMLVQHRNYIIQHVKAPLQKSIENIGKARLSWWKRLLLFIELLRHIKKYPPVTRENARRANSFVLMDIFDRFLRYENNAGRKPLFEAIFKVWLGEGEHDGYYDSRENFILEQIIIAILNGDWKPRSKGMPWAKHWNEPGPYGGTHSIIYKIQQHREEILKLIGGI